MAIGAQSHGALLARARAGGASGRAHRPAGQSRQYILLRYGKRHTVLTLPSGRRLAYPEARIGPGKYDGTTQIVFKDNARGGWSDNRAWYGTFHRERRAGGISRDLLAAAMQRLEAAGYSVVLHVHDEVVCEVADDFGSEHEFLRLMTELPDWAERLPLVAKVWSGQRYTKTNSAG